MSLSSYIPRIPEKGFGMGWKSLKSAKPADDLSVHKFGGGIWGASGEGIKDVDEALSPYGMKLIVVSAFDGVTERLRMGEWESVLATYACAGKAHIQSSEELKGFAQTLDGFRWRLERGRKFISKAEMWGLGELLSAELFYHHRKSAGKKVSRLEFGEGFPIIARNYKPDDADPDLEASRARRRAIKEALEIGEEVIIPGFLACTKDDQAVTLGEGASDTSAYVLAYAMNVTEVILWKETEGIRTANPDLIPGTRLVEYLTSSEGLNIALFGGKVLNYKGMRIGYEYGIDGKIKHIKPPYKCTNIVEKSEEPKEWAKKPTKYVGGTADALQVPVPYGMFSEFIEKVIENNLGDFTHIIGPALHPQLIILDRQKVYKMELTGEERKVLDSGRNVAVVSVVGDGLGPAQNVLKRGTDAISKNAAILGSVSSVRDGLQTEGAYMSFAVEPSLFSQAVKWLHEEFIEKDPAWRK